MMGYYIGTPPQSGERADPDKVLVEVRLFNPGTRSYQHALVTLREAWIIGQPGLVPPPGHHVAS